MTKLLEVGVAVTALLFCLMPNQQATGADNQEKQRPAIPPEMKVLEQRVGTWGTFTHFKAAQWTPEASESKGIEKIELVLHGRFIQGRVHTQPDNIEATWLGTYDPAVGAYRAWYFNSEGTITDAVGKWDAKTKTLTWTSTPQPGITSISHWRFLDRDTFEWDLIAKDRNGKVYLDMVGKLTRKP